MEAIDGVRCNRDGRCDCRDLSYSGVTMTDESKTDRVSSFRESLLNSRFAQTIAGDDLGCADIAKSDERTSPEWGIAILLGSSIVSIAAICGALWTLWSIFG